MKPRQQFPAVLAIYLAIFAVLPVFRSAAAWADDLRDSAQHLSDGAFALLNSISADSSSPGSSDVLGAVASFAGDAQAFAGALGKGDRAGASDAMASLLADRQSVDHALARNPGAINSSQWKSLEEELASLEGRVPPVKSMSARKSRETAPAGVVPVPATEADLNQPPPRVEISSRVYENGGVHVKGFLQGHDLKSAGIYDGDRLLSTIQLSPTTEGQRVNFDFALDHVTPTETIRVSDAMGRSGEAPVAPQAAAGAPRPGSHEKMIDLGAIRTPAGEPASPLPPVIASAPSSNSGSNTTEIPSKSPSRRHMHEGGTLAPLSGVQINLLGVMRSASEPNAYQVVGQISGEGVKRAGIYVDGKLVKPIPVTPGQYTSFDVVFPLLGTEATIRAYGNGANYVESSIDLSSSSGTVYGANPPVAPYGYPVNPYAARSPYGYPVNPYGSANPYAPPPYGYGYPPNGYPPNGYPPNGYPPNGYPPPNRPWWQKIF